MPWHFGYAGIARRGVANDLSAHRRRPELEHPRGQGLHVQPVGRMTGDEMPDDGEQAGRAWCSPRELGLHSVYAARSHRPARSELTAGATIRAGPRLRLLHRHHASASAARRARWPAKQWNQLPMDDFELHAARATTTPAQLSATTWRHVAFVEQPGSGPGVESTPASERLADDERRLQALRARRLPGGLPDRRHRPHRVRHGCDPAGHLQRLRLLRPRVPLRRRSTIDSGDGKAHKCTLCYDRLKGGLEPACAKACPTDSIQFGPVEELLDRARARVEGLRERGIPGCPRRPPGPRIGPAPASSAWRWRRSR